MIDEAQDTILRYILSHPGATVKHILRDLFEEYQERDLYRTLSMLVEIGYLKTSLMYEDRGARSPKLYFLTAKGAHAIGERIPRDHSKFLRSHIRQRGRIREYLDSITEQNNWYLIEENEGSRTIIAGQLKRASVKKYKKADPDYVYMSQVPLRISPDIVLFTGTEAYVVIIAHPNAERGAFKRILSKYNKIIYSVKFVCFTLTEDQKTQWEDVLRLGDLSGKTHYKDRFQIFSPKDLEELQLSNEVTTPFDKIKS